MKDQLRILSAKVLNLSTKLLRSGGMGTVKLGVNSVKKKYIFHYLEDAQLELCTYNSKINITYIQFPTDVGKFLYSSRDKLPMRNNHQQNPRKSHLQRKK